MVGNMVREEDSMPMGPLIHFSDCEVSSLVRSNTVWNIIRADKAICKSMKGGFGRSIICRKGKSITRISTYFSKDKAFSSSRRKWSSVVVCDQVAGLSSWKMVPYLGLNVCLCCWQIWDLASAVSKSVLVSGIPCFRVHT